MSRRSYSIAEARAHLPAIVDEVQAVGQVELTRRGTPVALVLSHQEYQRLRVPRSAFGDAYRRFLETFRLEEIGLDSELLDALRDTDSGRPVRL